MNQKVNSFKKKTQYQKFKLDKKKVNLEKTYRIQNKNPVTEILMEELVHLEANLREENHKSSLKLTGVIRDIINRSPLTIY